MSTSILSCCQASCLPEHHYQGCFLLVSQFWGQQGPICVACIILRVSMHPWWPRTSLVYACHYGILIGGMPSMHFENCSGLDIKLYLTQTLCSISKSFFLSSWTYLFLSIHTNTLWTQDYFTSCIHLCHFLIPHQGGFSPGNWSSCHHCHWNKA